MKKHRNLENTRDLIKFFEEADVYDKNTELRKKQKEKGSDFDWREALKQIECEWDKYMRQNGAIHFVPNRYLINELISTEVRKSPGAHPAVLVYEHLGVYYWAHGSSNENKIKKIANENGCLYQTLPKKSLSRLDYKSFIQNIRKQKPKNEKELNQIRNKHQKKFPEKDTHFLSSWALLHRSPWRPKRDTFICLSSVEWFNWFQTKMIP